MALFSAALGGLQIARQAYRAVTSSGSNRAPRVVAADALRAPATRTITGMPAGAGTVVSRAAAQRAADTVTVDVETGQVVEKKRRRRRRRLLTCADRADISFITATLGKGAMGQQAIAALLARCN